MADGDPVPDEDHVVRYCKNTQVDGGRALGAAFQLEATHTELSVNWLERLSAEAPRKEQLQIAREAMAKTMRLKQNGWLAVLQTLQFTSLAECSGTALALVVRHHPVEGNDGHSGVHGMPEVASALATEVGLALAQRVAEPLVQIKQL
jgi:hypothetical protein